MKDQQRNSEEDREIKGKKGHLLGPPRDESDLRMEFPAIWNLLLFRSCSCE
jgi:hypothetical protein